ncbi:MAG: glutathione S-transferase N-terminal domain-containing protein, partial [Pseudomonadota bacterium]
MIELTGSPGSPYTRKMVALLRFRRLPFCIHWTNGRIPDDYPKPKVALLPTVYFTKEDGTREVAIDSTPLIARLDAEHPERGVLPSDPALRFFCDL